MWAASPSVSAIISRATERSKAHLACLAAALLLAADALGAGLAADPDNYRQLLRRLVPGDTLELAPGDYRQGLPLQHLSGEPGRPIVIAGPAQGAPAVFHARPGHNTVSIVDASHLVVRNLVLDGGHLAVDAVKAEGHARWAHHITLENLTIRGHGNNQQTVGISTKCPAWNWVLRGNTIVGAGTGMYLGNSDGAAPFVAGLIERNLIVDSLGYALQIKHQRSRPALPGMPAGDSLTVIRRNVFARPEAGSAEAPRPSVLLGHLPPDGPGANDGYAVYGNFFYQNRLEALFQGEGNIALYDNLFVNRHGDAIRIQPHNDIPKRITIAHNTVLAAGTGISVTQKEGAPAHRQVVAANAVFAATPMAGGEQRGNFGASPARAEAHLRRPLAAPGELDLSPLRPMRAEPGAVAELAGLPDSELDFDGRAREPGAAGAYGASAADPRWLPRLERMPE